jgi:hypothetical protein
MQIRRFGYVLSVSAAATLLAGCGGSSYSLGPTAGTAGPLAPQKSKQRFLYTGAQQSFVVPSGVTKIKVIAYGASGGGKFYPSNYDEVPGFGGRVSADVPVRPGETLYVFVGGTAQSNQGGFNGGGSAVNDGWPGGGASDVREGGTALSDRILVAGGGGGAGGAGIYNYSGQGGGGGGEVGETGGSDSNVLDGLGAPGGSQSAGGLGAAGGKSPAKKHAGGSGAAGALGIGGDGGTAGSAIGNYGFSGGGGGGGGGGYYGGGGGGGGAGTRYGVVPGTGGGGGGGSSYVERAAKKYSSRQNVRNSNGLVIFSW